MHTHAGIVVVCYNNLYYIIIIIINCASFYNKLLFGSSCFQQKNVIVNVAMETEQLQLHWFIVIWGRGTFTLCGSFFRGCGFSRLLGYLKSCFISRFLW